MTTGQQAQSNRENGRKSRGPVTPEGRARSSRNAMRHGAYAGPQAVRYGPFCEDQSVLDAEEAAIVESLNPSNGIQRRQAREVAVAYLALDRAHRYEQALLDEVARAVDDAEQYRSQTFAGVDALAEQIALFEQWADLLWEGGGTPPAPVTREVAESMISLMAARYSRPGPDEVKVVNLVGSGPDGELTDSEWAGAPEVLAVELFGSLAAALNWVERELVDAVRERDRRIIELRVRVVDRALDARMTKAMELVERCQRRLAGTLRIYDQLRAQQAEVD